MTSRNSSTFSSSRFLRLACISALTTGVALCLISFAGLRYGYFDFHFNELYQYQLKKLDSKRQVDIVFIGDSSLGNAIDAAQVAKKSGKSAVNLALTGAYGYGGTYNMLRRVSAAWHPEIVIIMQTPAMMMRPHDHKGFIHTAMSAADIIRAPLVESSAVIANLDNIMSMLRRAVRSSVGNDLVVISSDYIRQESALDHQHVRDMASGDSINASAINYEQLHYIGEIAQYCQSHGIRCIYAHGSWPKGLCDRAEEYFRAVNSLITKTGLAVLPETPLCVSVEDVGDAPDHVAPTRKAEYSDRFLILINRYLGTKNRMPDANSR